jgi:hypothetical protein
LPWRPPASLKVPKIFITAVDILASIPVSGMG